MSVPRINQVSVQQIRNRQPQAAARAMIKTQEFKRTYGQVMSGVRIDASEINQTAYPDNCFPGYVR
ncbi:MAG TPA: hypothetical protein VF369_05535 [candidate division Zixibacteria bacterium]